MPSLRRPLFYKPDAGGLQTSFYDQVRGPRHYSCVVCYNSDNEYGTKFNGDDGCFSIQGSLGSSMISLRLLSHPSCRHPSAGLRYLPSSNVHIASLSRLLHDILANAFRFPLLVTLDDRPILVSLAPLLSFVRSACTFLPWSPQRMTRGPCR